MDFFDFGFFDGVPAITVTRVVSIGMWDGNGSTIGIIGMFCVMDAIREEAKAVIQGLRDAHIDTMICTGDSDSAAQAVARGIGIPPGAVHSQLLPEDKLHFVGSLRRPQPRGFALCTEKRYVLFCGDGVNDAPALAGKFFQCFFG